MNNKRTSSTLKISKLPILITVEVKFLRSFKIRKKVAICLFFIAAWIAPCVCEIDVKDKA